MQFVSRHHAVDAEIISCMYCLSKSYKTTRTSLANQPLEAYKVSREHTKIDSLCEKTLCMQKIREFCADMTFVND